MEYFDKYVSNTLAATSNQMYFSTNYEIKKGRIYIDYMSADDLYRMEEYLDIDKIIPISNICSMSEVPPELKNGRDIPVFGIVFVTTAMFIAT